MDDQYGQMSFERRDQDHLTQLPKELFLHTLHFIKNFDECNALVKYAFLALRRCSKQICAASDSARPCITLHQRDIHNAAILLRKLTNVANVTILASQSQTPASDFPSHMPIHPLILPNSDLRLVSSTIPNLTSLTMHCDSKLGMHVIDIQHALSPCWQIFKRLVLFRCTLVMSSADGNLPLPVKVGFWCPDLPHLTSLVLTDSSLTFLDLNGCPMLQELELESNMLLSTLRLSGVKSLRRLLSRGSKQLIAPDLSCCIKLDYLCLHHSPCVTSLVLIGCTTLREFHCRGNACLASVSLSACSLLEHLTCEDNLALGSLDLSHCNLLKSLRCSSNPLLFELDLVHKSALQALSCTSNNSLSKLQLSGCSALQQLDLVSNDSLSCLDVSGQSALENIDCFRNPALLSVKASFCKAVRTVMCVDNFSVSSLDLSGCTALVSLMCKGNRALTSLNLAGCIHLKSLIKSECELLGEVDVSSCLALH